jgi:putative transposase
LQQRLLEERLEECRWLYNHLLAKRREAWDQRQESARYYDQANNLPVLKAERLSLVGLHSQVVQHVTVRIDPALQSFFAVQNRVRRLASRAFGAWGVMSASRIRKRQVVANWTLKRAKRGYIG